MTDQTEPREYQPFRDQSLNADNQAGQALPVGQNPGQAPQFVAPAESFGSFGPLPNYPTGTPYNEPQLSPAPFTPASAQMPTSGTSYSPAPVAPTNTQAPAAGAFYSPAPLATNAYPPFPAPGIPYAPSMQGALPYPPYGMYPPLPVPVKTKKPLLFPLTRKAPALLQIFGMLLYSLLLALSVMGCLLTLFRASITSTSMYVNLDGSVNGLSILITLVLLLLLIPAGSLFSGAFFGSWRGLLVSLFSLGGGFVLAHITDPRFGNPDATLLNYLPFAAPALAALVVGFVYERRKYAAWWKSMFSMFLGVAVLLIWFFVSVYLFDVNAGTLDILASAAHMTIQNYMAYMAISLGCLSLLIIPLLGLLYAGIEGIIHAILARIGQTH